MNEKHELFFRFGVTCVRIGKKLMVSRAVEKVEKRIPSIVRDARGGKGLTSAKRTVFSGTILLRNLQRNVSSPANYTT